MDHQDQQPGVVIEILLLITTGTYHHFYLEGHGWNNPIKLMHRQQRNQVDHQ